MCFLLMTSGLVRILKRTLQFYIICIWMSKGWGMSFVYGCPVDGGRDGLWWPALFRTLVVLYRMLARLT